MGGWGDVARSGGENCDIPMPCAKGLHRLRLSVCVDQPPMPRAKGLNGMESVPDDGRWIRLRCTYSHIHAVDTVLEKTPETKQKTQHDNIFMS